MVSHREGPAAYPCLPSWLGNERKLILTFASLHHFHKSPPVLPMVIEIKLETVYFGLRELYHAKHRDWILPRVGYFYFFFSNLLLRIATCILAALLEPEFR